MPMCGTRARPQSLRLWSLSLGELFRKCNGTLGNAHYPTALASSPEGHRPPSCRRERSSTLAAPRARLPARRWPPTWRGMAPADVAAARAGASGEGTTPAAQPCRVTAAQTARERGAPDEERHQTHSEALEGNQRSGRHESAVHRAETLVALLMRSVIRRNQRHSRAISAPSRDARRAPCRSPPPAGRSAGEHETRARRLHCNQVGPARQPRRHRNVIRQFRQPRDPGSCRLERAAPPPRSPRRPWPLRDVLATALDSTARLAPASHSSGQPHLVC